MEAVALPIIEAAAGEIANDSVALIKRQIGYLIHYNAKIKNLEEELEKLDAKNNGVMQLVDAGKRNLHNIAPDVVLWQGKVVPIIQTVSEFLDNEIRGNDDKCLSGMCPNLKSRYSLSRKATKMAMKIGILLQEASNFGPISYPGPPPRMGSMFITQGIEDFRSRLLIVHGVWEALQDDNIQMISVCGMGGVGKTTMVKKLIQRVEEHDMYDKIAMAVVSQNPDLEKIQGEIIERLGLEIQEKTLSGRAGKLREWIMNYDKGILLILDDVWEELSFEAIGIPFTVENVKGYKTLLTSRSEFVCSSMGSQRNFQINVLEDGEAWDLFRKLAGNFVDLDLQDIAKEIATECGGLPIAIATVAGALKNKAKYAWSDALRKLKKSNLTGVSGMEKVYTQIELSFNYLKCEEAKLCFLLCSLFPEDSSVPIESLVRYGMGLRLFEDVDDFHQARDRVCALVDDLKDSSLLLDGDDYGFKSVKMHDVIRDVAISIGSKYKHYLVSSNAVMKKWPEMDRCKDSTAISIICSDIKELPIDMEYPMLQLLQLKYRSSLKDLKNNIFGGMKQLQVLILNIPSLPKSLDFPKKLRTLLLIGNLESRELPKEIGALTSLEILEIQTIYLKELPKEIAFLENLRLLDLRNIRRLGHIPSGVLSKLSKLEELYVTKEFYKWESKGDGGKINASLRELDCLPLTALQIRVPNFSLLPQKSIFQNLISFDILKGSLRYVDDDFFRTDLDNKLRIIGGPVAKIKVSGICSLLRKTEALRLENVMNLNSVNELADYGFLHLKKIIIKNCYELEYIVDVMILKEIPIAVFPKLERLELSELRNLKCGFPLSVARGMRQLQSMRISNCQNMEGIFYRKEEDDEKITTNEVEFPNLKSLELHNLPKLIGFWADMKVPLDNMEQPNASKSEQSSNSTSQVSTTLFPSPCQHLSNLEQLKLVKCNSLHVVFAPSIAQQLVQLQTLRILECKRMEYVVGVVDEGQEEKEKPLFPMLNELYLENLPELVAFCADDHVSLAWHLLKVLWIFDCRKMKPFGCSSGLVRRGREQQSIEPQNQHLLSTKQVSLMKNGDSFVSHIDHQCTFPYNLTERLQNLEMLTIKGSNFEVIFSFKGHHAGVGLVNSLKELDLIDLKNVTHIWFKIPLEITGFENLAKLEVSKCCNLIHIFAPHLPKLLVKLRYMRIHNCEKMKTIVGKDDKEASESTLDNIVFPQLRSLKLIMLPNLKSFCGGTSVVELPSLEYLEIDGCNQMENFAYGASNTLKLEEIKINERHYALEGDLTGAVNKEAISDSMEQPNIFKSGQSSSSTSQVISTLFPSPWHCLSNLQQLKLTDCSLLKVAFAPYVAHQLVQLNALEIMRCEKMEYVVGVGDGRQEEKDCSLLPKLNILRLGGLLEFVAFFPDEHVSLDWHCLKELWVSDCRKMKTVGCSSRREQQSIEPRSQNLLSNKQVSPTKNVDSSTSHLEDLHAFFPYNLMQRLQNLEKLTVERCDSLEVMFSFKEHHADVGAFNSVKDLTISALRNLTHIWFKIPSETIGFQNLEKLEVDGCENLVHIFSPHLPKLLVKLQNMKIGFCENMKAIVAKEDKAAPESTSDKVVFPQLRSLKLIMLPSLKSFCGGTSPVELPSLESFEIYWCNQMRKFSYGPSNTPKLKEISINAQRYAQEGDL